MKVSYEWLSEYLMLEEITPETLADKMSRTGIEVEEVSVLGKDLKKIVVGHALEVREHSNSDHLKICKVDTGEQEIRQIICGAPNIRSGQKVIVALPGARIAGNVKIKKSKMRGEVSEGMICSLSELGYPDHVVAKKYAEGIYILPDDAVPGESIIPYLALDDAVLELSITPNRADALSMRGVAHEVGAIYDQKPIFSPFKLEESADETIDRYLTVAVESSEDSPHYAIRVIKDVTIAESPLWLQKKLMNAGIRPINNVVDITNYILLEYGQPLHAFDYDALGSKEITVRRAKEKEAIVTLDGEKRMLSPETIVITNGEKPIALAGVMGGLDSEITEETVTVALEAAVFHPIAVRKTANGLNLRSEASSRFEKGVNLATVNTAGDHAASLIAELTGGKVVSGRAVKTIVDPEEIRVSITLEKINRSTGLKLSVPEVLDIFERLDFKVDEARGLFEVKIPPRRWDIRIEADLIEEVARIYGYDRLPSTLPVSESVPGTLTDKQRLIRHTRRFLEGAGLSQAISYVLTTPEKAGEFKLQESEATHLDRPMSKERRTLRMNIVSGLLDNAAYNTARNNRNVSLYEIGHVFYREKDQDRPYETEHLSGMITGETAETNWKSKARKVDFFDLKGILESLLETYGLKENVVFTAEEDRDGMHPGRTAAVHLGSLKIGFIGQVHPLTAAARDLSETYVFEINLDTVLHADKRPTIYKAIPKYPGTTRDIALLVDETVTNQELIEVLYENGGHYLKGVRLFDIYQGRNIEEGKKSMAYTLSYLNSKATLEEEEVAKDLEKVTKALVQRFGAVIR